MRKLLQLFFIMFFVSRCIAQDSLRGAITAERAWWDVVKYDITVVPDATAKTIEGSNIITFKTLKDGARMQIDLQEPMEIMEVTGKKENGKTEQVSFNRNKNVYYLNFKDRLKKNQTYKIEIKFSGQTIRDRFHAQ